jgi:hypothetical protein
MVLGYRTEVRTTESAMKKRKHEEYVLTKRGSRITAILFPLEQEASADTVGGVQYRWSINFLI